jgi:hypothetical protein
MKYLPNIFIAVAIILAGFGIYKAETVVVPTQTLGYVNPVTPAVFETYLANAEGTGDTSLTLASGALRDGTNLNGYVCLTIDSNTSSLEYECGTASGTTVSSLQRGLDATTGTTTVASLIYAHRRGADVKITDYPTLTIVNNQLNGVQSIPNPIFYALNPNFTSLASTTLASIGYVASTSYAGTVNATNAVKGIIQLATGLQAASSTSLGSTGAALVLPATIATDTPNVGTNTSDVIMSNLLGYINQGWLNLAQAFNVSGLWTFSGGATFNTATTTFNGGLSGVYNYQDITTTGTWTAPSNITGTEQVIVQIWGGGGGGANLSGSTDSSGGGGGAYNTFTVPISALTSTVTVTIGAGGTPGNAGGTTSFGSYLYAYGGASGVTLASNGICGGGGGGGTLSGGGQGVCSTSPSSATAGAGGSPMGDTTGAGSSFGGGAGGGKNASAGASQYGGGGGGEANSGGCGGYTNGGSSVYGGGGGGGACTSSEPGGSSNLGGAGGASGVSGNATNGTAPGGGGGGVFTSGTAGSGARGEVRVWVIK